METLYNVREQKPENLKEAISTILNEAYEYYPHLFSQSDAEELSLYFEDVWESQKGTKLMLDNFIARYIEFSDKNLSYSILEKDILKPQ